MLNPEDIPDKEVREWYLHSLTSFDKDSADKYPIIADKYPSTLEIESTSRCNVNPPCPMCARVRRVKYGKREDDLPWHIVDRLGTALASAKHISISGIGEPMLADCFDKMLQLGSSGNAGISFFSNGQILTDAKLDLIFDNNVVAISFSLDAATHETYRKIRGFTLETLDIVKKNITRIIKKRGTRDKPWISLVMVVMKENYTELPKLVELAHELKVNGVKYWRMRPPSVIHDYTDHFRYDFKFSYEEQSKLPNDFDQIVQSASDKATDYCIHFQEN